MFAADGAERQLQPLAQQWRPSTSAATLQQLVALLTAHEPDLTDRLLELCKRRHSAAHKRQLPPHPEGPLRTFAVTVPKGTTQIAKGAFWRCPSLTEITLPPALTKIGQGAFQDCTSLAEITLPPTLTEIGKGAFQSCKSLAEITLPPTLTEIGPMAFEGCPGTPRRHESVAVVTRAPDPAQ